MSLLIVREWIFILWDAVLKGVMVLSHRHMSHLPRVRAGVAALSETGIAAILPSRA